jgi:hypothetical protein
VDITERMVARAAACVSALPQLDYSRASIAKLDDVVALAGAFLNAPRRDPARTPTEEHRRNQCLMYGAYYGETIRRHLGGTWKLVQSTPVLSFRGVELGVVDKIARRMESDSDNLESLVSFIEVSEPWAALLRARVDLDADPRRVIVLVLPRTCTEPDARRILQPFVDRATCENTWRWVDDIGVSFSAAVWWLSPNLSLLDDDDDDSGFVGDYLRAAAKELCPAFAYATIFGEEAAPSQLRHRFQLLEREDWEGLVRGGDERLFVPLEHRLVTSAGWMISDVENGRALLTREA